MTDDQYTDDQYTDDESILSNCGLVSLTNTTYGHSGYEFTADARLSPGLATPIALRIRVLQDLRIYTVNMYIAS